MPDIESLFRAHRAGVGLLKTMREYFSAVYEIHMGVPADDPRLLELTPLKLKLRDELEKARTRVEPALVEFNCVHAWPLEIAGQMGSSAHQIVLKSAAWLVGRSWATDTYQRFFEKFFNEETKMDWAAVKAADDRTADGTHYFCEVMHWDEMESLLHMEYAKARKLAMSPGADVPKLAPIESEVLTALGDDLLTGREISKRSGYPYNSNLKNRLPRMVDKDLLEKMKPHGYRRGPAAPPV